MSLYGAYRLTFVSPGRSGGGAWGVQMFIKTLDGKECLIALIWVASKDIWGKETNAEVWYASGLRS